MTLSAPRPTSSVVARSSDVAEGGRYVVAVRDDLHIGLFRFRGRLYAYENTCPHQGGPVCQGRLVDGVRERLDAHRHSLGLAFDEDDPHIVCPWHGFEYRITTGEHPGAPRFRLRSFAVTEENGEISVAL
ncbi:Rieske (2Fe-2S) protein [Amycolatopsis thermophila]|uniref:Nitrite reductase/ring-hydroxylating ferredoxin subunit n=1 Tax=Amycolatopsis thermophila TaxID=206084 RepID=A0ABU0F610_9PSEU|nr:Rieske 2Fe-2S domain-containing protein [Amycolatopsis thermophila]MDQ0383028.1 nitrite reductase/ring-hydroxylating ferredoxin subunit [Amycolatopsis thermophila]